MIGYPHLVATYQSERQPSKRIEPPSLDRHRSLIRARKSLDSEADKSCRPRALITRHTCFSVCDYDACLAQALWQACDQMLSVLL